MTEVISIHEVMLMLGVMSLLRWVIKFVYIIYLLYDKNIAIEYNSELCKVDDDCNVCCCYSSNQINKTLNDYTLL